MGAEVIRPNSDKNHDRAVQAIIAGKGTVIGAQRRFIQQTPQRAGRLLYVFTDADLRMGHDGLAREAKKHKTKEFPDGIDVAQFMPGQLVVFVNSQMDKFKVFAAHGVVAYKRLDKGQILDMRVLQYIPQAFSVTGRIDYEKALANVIENAYRGLHPRKAKAHFGNPETKSDQE